jgi:hypothetical protein
MTTTIDGTEFAVTDHDVQECGTPLHYDPATGKGYQLVYGQRVALTSYAAFGSDLNRARKAADHWTSKAKRAWLAMA